MVIDATLPLLDTLSLLWASSSHRFPTEKMPALTGHSAPAHLSAAEYLNIADKGSLGLEYRSLIDLDKRIGPAIPLLLTPFMIFVCWIHILNDSSKISQRCHDIRKKEKRKYRRDQRNNRRKDKERR